MKEEQKEGIVAIILVAAVILGIIGIILGWFTTETVDEDLIYQVGAANNPSLGNPNAPVTIIEFSDFSCSFCAAFVNQTKPALQAHIDAGTVYFVFRDFPLTALHPKAAQVAKAAGCAYEQGNEYFWKYHDLVYLNIDKQEISHLHFYATKAGLDIGEYESCFASDRRFVEIQRDTQVARELGLTGTPTFFVNGKMYRGFLTPEQLDAAVAEALSRG